jgi:hypothetical protein
MGCQCSLYPPAHTCCPTYGSSQDNKNIRYFLGKLMDQQELLPGIGVSSFQQLEKLFFDKGVKQIFVKHLPKKQDNEKNQIVLGSKGASNLLSLFPSQMSYRRPSLSKKKRKSKAGEPIVEMDLDFRWMYADGSCFEAPDAKIINYFQYPEARLSGFFNKCKVKPGSLRRKDRELYRTRILILGANNDEGITYGMALSDVDDPVVNNFPQLQGYELVPVLRTHVIGAVIGIAPRELLLEEIKQISGKWHPGVTLKKLNGPTTPCNDKRGGGLTLEALLNIPANALKEPDKHGYEIKSFKRNGKVSLMTPTADMGEEGRMTFRCFMQNFGWPPVRSSSVTQVFNGVFKYRKKKFCRHIGRNLTLDIQGYDPKSRKFELEEDSVYVTMTDPEAKLLVSCWSMDKLLSSWTDKHAAACYVEYEKRKYQGTNPKYKWEYRYAGKIILGEGTDIWKYLEGIGDQVVYYDPAHDITVKGKTNQRPQWRLQVKSDFAAQLSSLYEKVTDESVI